MTKLYAIVKPAYTFKGQGLVEIPCLLLEPIHKLMYETVCNFSLGHEVDFFDCLDEAKNEFELAVANNREYEYGATVQNAIIELDRDGKDIKGFLNMYTVREIGSTNQFAQQPDRFFKAQYIPLWNTQVISHGDVSSNALNEINRQYRDRIELPLLVP